MQNSAAQIPGDPGRKSSASEYSGGLGRMNRKIQNETIDHLFDAILTLENRDECYDFFSDLCTVNELISLSTRLEVAALLRKQQTYQEIVEQTGASTATISRVKNSMAFGFDGYELAFGRLEAQQEEKND